jgi:hypothetical protein
VLVYGLVVGAIERVPEPSVSVTGQTVVEMAIVEVTTIIELAGQLVTVGAQSVEVTAVVVYTVDVVSRTGVDHVAMLVTAFELGNTEVFAQAVPVTREIEVLV